MVTVSSKLTAFLDEHGADYEVIHHRRDFTAQHTAADTHTPGQEFAKTVVVLVGDNFAIAVLPAHHRVDLEELRDALGKREVRLASEAEIGRLCPDCEVGAEPPFGNLYYMPVYLSRAMVGNEHITFNAGSHEDAIRMRFADFERLVQPRVLDFSRPAEPGPQRHAWD